MFPFIRVNVWYNIDNPAASVYVAACAGVFGYNTIKIDGMWHSFFPLLSALQDFGSEDERRINQR